jgi:hypothetical protein
MRYMSRPCHVQLLKMECISPLVNRQTRKKGVVAGRIARTYPAADTAGMAKKPEPPVPITWDVYRAAHKPKIVGSVQAVDADEAVQKAAQEIQGRCLAPDSGAAAMTLILRRRKCSLTRQGSRFPQHRYSANAIQMRIIVPLRMVSL